jgi:hypothetical protein
MAEPENNPAAAADDVEAAAAHEQHGKMPPATLSSLITILGTQTLMALGQIPDPVSGKPQADLEQANHFIDLLGMLDTKTAGNRTPEEAQLLEDVLHQLRMMYVAAKK